MRRGTGWTISGQPWKSTLEQRPYDGAAGLRVLLLDTGFQPVDVCGDLDHLPYDASARRRVTLARKAAS